MGLFSQSPVRPPAVVDAARRRLLLSLAAAAAAGGCRSRGTLTLACAAGWRDVVDAALVGLPVRTTYDGSGRLTSMIRMGLRVDLFLAADRSYLDELVAEGFGYDVRPLRTQRVCCVRSPTSADRTWEELAGGGHRVSLASPRSAAVSRVLRSGVGAETFDRLASVAAHRVTVTEVAADVAATGAADYGFIWDTTWPDDGRLIEVPMPELTAAVGTVALGVPSGGGDKVVQERIAAAVRATPARDDA